MFKTINADSLSSVFTAVKVATAVLSKESECNALEEYKLPKGSVAPLIWYRGQERETYKLDASVLRARMPSEGRNYPPRWTPDYNESVAQEKARIQVFNARAYHIIDNMPDNDIGWQEIMQHHSVKTRLLDWSESVIPAMLFSLESFLADSSDDKYKYKRINASPVIWLLNPAVLNANVYSELTKNSKFLTNSLSEFNLSQKVLNQTVAFLLNELVNNKSRNLNVANEFRGSALINLSYLSNYRASISGNLYNRLISGEFNPFYYMMLRLYADGIQPPADLPPLAAVQPHHSPRITAQKGAFTVFTHPPIDKDAVLPLNQISCAQQAIFMIRLIKPQKIADEILKIGLSREDLYPELETFAQEMERRQY